ncbi:MAG: DUF4870 domain-containing protein [Sedimentisphaerales bacterium]|nr:DUF4870 domain-containing protein [Sedimentisphaerales bacterium]
MNVNKDPYAPLPQEPPLGSPSGPTELTSDDRTWGMFCHLAALAGFVGVPFGNILGPLLVWIIKKDQMPYVNHHGKEALNFQISLMIYGFALGVFALPCLCFPPLLILPLLGAIILGIIGLVFTIMAAIQANNGYYYEYPMSIRLVK